MEQKQSVSKTVGETLLLTLHMELNTTWLFPAVPSIQHEPEMKIVILKQRKKITENTWFTTKITLSLFDEH
jgi:hypothetical protein